MHVGQASLGAVVVIGQAFMVDAEKMQGGSVEVVTVFLSLDSLPSEIIGRAVADSALDPASRHPRREGARVVIATFGLRIALAFHLRGRLTTELGGADHQGLVEHSSRFQIF